MNILLRSLWGRTVLVIVMLIVLSNVITHALINFYFTKPGIKQRLTLIGENLNEIYTALETLPANQRQQFITQLPLSEKYFMITSINSHLPYPLLSQHSRIDKLINQYIAPQLADHYDEIRVQKEGRSMIWFGFPLADQKFWVGVPFYNIQSRFSWNFLIFLSIAGALAILGSFWLVRKINQSLGELTQAAEELGRGNQPEKLREDGPLEIQQLSRAFNEMSTDINTLTKNRILLLAGVSHDLRTPLSRIRLTIEMLEANNIEQTKEELVQDIEAIDSIIEQFLLFVREGSEEKVLRTDINKILSDVCQRYQHQKMELELGDLPEIMIKPVAMQRVFINLLENACKYGADPIKIISKKDTDKVIIKIMDSGPGIPEAEKQRLLEPFTQLNKTINVDGGIGLGLAIAKRLIEKHQGQLSLHNRQGGGLMVLIELPI